MIRRILEWFFVLLVVLGGIYISFNPALLEIWSEEPPTYKYTFHPRTDYFGLEVQPTDGDGEVVWLTGTHGTVIHRSKAGDTWYTQPTPSTSHLQDIAAVNEDEAIVVGGDQTVLVTDDGGETWKINDPKPQPIYGNNFLRVRIAPNQSAWVVGQGGILMSTRDSLSESLENDSLSWVQRTPQKDVIWNDVGFPDETTVVAVGERGRLRVGSDTEGAPGGMYRWSEKSLGVNQTFNSVAFRNSRSGVVVGLKGMIFRTENGGDSWTRVQTDLGNQHLWDIHWNGRNWIAAGSSGYLLRGTPDGTEWEVVQADNPVYAWRTEARTSYKNPGRIYLVGDKVGYWENQTWYRIGSRN